MSQTKSSRTACCGVCTAMRASRAGSAVRPPSPKENGAAAPESCVETIGGGTLDVSYDAGSSASRPAVPVPSSAGSTMVRGGTAGLPGITFGGTAGLPGMMVGGTAGLPGITFGGSASLAGVPSTNFSVTICLGLVSSKATSSLTTNPSGAETWFIVYLPSGTLSKPQPPLLSVVQVATGVPRMLSPLNMANAA